MTAAESRLYVAHLARVESHALWYETPLPLTQAILDQADELEQLADELDDQADAMGVDREAAWRRWLEGAET